MLDIKKDDTLYKLKKIKKVRYLYKEFIVKLEEFFALNFIYSIFNSDRIKKELNVFLIKELPDIKYKLKVDDYYKSAKPMVIISIDEFNFEIKIEL